MITDKQWPTQKPWYVCIFLIDYEHEWEYHSIAQSGSLSWDCTILFKEIFLVLYTHSSQFQKKINQIISDLLSYKLFVSFGSK